MLEDIALIYDKNFERIIALVTVYRNLTENKAGRIPIRHLDLLRASVVMMHSTLEDFIRNVLKWRLPYSDAALSGIPIYTSDYNRRKIKFELNDLVEHRSRVVDSVIKESVKNYLDTVSFNNTNDISVWLEKIDIDITTDMRKTYRLLQNMITRRHEIVHQADRNSDRFIPGWRVNRINLQMVESWYRNVDVFVSEVSSCLRNSIDNMEQGNI